MDEPASTDFRKEENVKMRIKSSDTVMTNQKTERPKPVHWIFLLLCVVCYIALSVSIFYITSQETDYLNNINLYFLLDILAQGQVLAVILITLNPIRRSYLVGLVLCGLSIIVALVRILQSGAIYMLPGVIVPITAIIIASILNNLIKRSKQGGTSLLLANELLQKVLDTIPMPIFWKDLHSNFLGCNQLFAEEAGKGSPVELIGKDDYSTPSGDQTEKYRADDAEIMQSGIAKINIEELHVTASGEQGWIRTTKAPLRDANGEIFGLLGAFEDITKKRLAEQDLYYEKERLRVTLLSIGDAVITTDPGKKITLINSVAEKLTGWHAKDALGKEFDLVLTLENELTTKKARNPIDEVLSKGKTVKLANHTRVISRQGIKRIIEDSAAPILGTDGSVQGVVMVFRDVTDKKIKQDEVLYLNYHDHLTTLYNRRFFEEEMKRLDTKRNLPLSIIMGDINGLKLINDSFGHSTGDEYLKKSAEIIKSVCRADDIIARLGGDEFVILLPKADDTEAIKIISRIKDMISKQKIGNIELSVSFGYDTKVKEEQSIKEILENAENHMYRHKIYEHTSMRSKTIDVIMNALFEKSDRESHHSTRVSGICELIASAMSFESDDVNQIRVAGLVHDIGKIGIDEKILNKVGRLSDYEWQEIRKHPEAGWRILSSSNEFSEVSRFVLHHHEKFDGSGYPNGAKGEEIPIESRIITIADAFDAMTGERSYRDSLSADDAAKEIKRCSGTQFDPQIVAVFINKVFPHLI
jgi:diguanylate cyclase